MIEIKWNPEKRDLQYFGVLLMPFSWFVAYQLDRHFGSGPLVWSVLGVGILAAVLGVAQPKLLRWVYVAWMTTIFPIGWIVSHALFAIVFYLVFTPAGLLMRMIGKDPMHRAWENDRVSYWEPILSDHDLLADPASVSKSEPGSDSDKTENQQANLDAIRKSKERYFRQF